MSEYKITTVTDELKEVEVTKFSYKSMNKTLPRMIKECDKFFGQGQWEQVKDYSNSLGNILGWYARSTEENNYNTLNLTLA